MNTFILTESQEKELINLYLNKKYNLSEVAKYFSFKSYGPVKRILIKNKINLRSKGELRSKGRYNLDIEYFKNINSIEKAYWLGVICADGHIRKSDKTAKDANKLILLVKDTDRELIHRLKKALKSNHKISEDSILDKRTKKYYYRCTIQISCKNFVSYIKKLGIDENKSHKCDFPKINEEFYSHFIRGLMDGDGCVRIKGNCLNAKLIATKPIIYFIQEYLFNKFKIPKKCLAKVDGNNNDIISLNLNGLNAKEFLDFVYKDSTMETRLERKYIIYKNNLDFYQDKKRHTHKWIYFVKDQNMYMIRYKQDYLGKVKTLDEAKIILENYLKTIK